MGMFLHFNKEELVGFTPERLTYSELDRAVDATAEGLLGVVHFIEDACQPTWGASHSTAW